MQSIGYRARRALRKLFDRFLWPLNVRLPTLARSQGGQPLSVTCTDFAGVRARDPIAARSSPTMAVAASDPILVTEVA